MARALFNGSKKQVLHNVALNIFNLCVDNKINLLPEWVPRDDNVIADMASKNVDRNDFMLHPDIFTALNILWGGGGHTIDIFSSSRLRQLPMLNSRWANLVPKVLMLFLSDGIMRIRGYSHLRTFPKRVTTFGFYRSRRDSNRSRMAFSSLVALGL